MLETVIFIFTLVYADFNSPYRAISQDPERPLAHLRSLRQHRLQDQRLRCSQTALLQKPFRAPDRNWFCPMGSICLRCRAEKQINLYAGLTEKQKNWYNSVLQRNIDAVTGLTGKKERKTRLMTLSCSSVKIAATDGAVLNLALMTNGGGGGQ